MYNCETEDCDGILVEDGNDYRQEWSDVYFYCQKCGAEYTLHTVYKTQSNIIKSQDLIKHE